MPSRSSASSFFRISRPVPRMTSSSNLSIASKPCSHGAIILLFGEAEDVLPVLEHLATARPSDRRAQTSVSFQITPFSLNRSLSLVNAAFTAAGVAVTVGQARLACVFFRKVGKASIIGKKMMSSCFFGWIDVKQVVHVRNAHLRGEAGIDGAALGAFLVKLFAGVFGPDHVLRLHAQSFEIGGEERPAASTYSARAGMPICSSARFFTSSDALLLRRRSRRIWAADRPPPAAHSS